MRHRTGDIDSPQWADLIRAPLEPSQGWVARRKIRHRRRAGGPVARRVARDDADFASVGWHHPLLIPPDGPKGWAGFRFRPAARHPRLCRALAHGVWASAWDDPWDDLFGPRPIVRATDLRPDRRHVAHEGAPVEAEAEAVAQESPAPHRARARR